MGHQHCPLCSDLADYEWFDHNNRKRFLCGQCGRFIVTVRAERWLLESPAQWREALRAKVKKAPEGKILEIRLSPVHSRQPGVAHPALESEYIPR